MDYTFAARSTTLDFICVRNVLFSDKNAQTKRYRAAQGKKEYRRRACELAAGPAR